MGKAREKIYEALRDIPDQIIRGKHYLQIYGETKDFRLSQKTAQLFSAILNALEIIIQFMTERHFCTLINHFSHSFTHLLTVI